MAFLTAVNLSSCRGRQGDECEHLLSLPDVERVDEPDGGLAVRAGRRLPGLGGHEVEPGGGGKYTYHTGQCMTASKPTHVLMVT